MTEHADLEARLTALESRLAAVEPRLDEVAADAAAARHLAAARDRDLADLTIKVDANRRAINALGIQTAARFDRLETKVDQLDVKVNQLDVKVDQLDVKVDTGFLTLRAGMQQIVDLLTRDDDG